MVQRNRQKLEERLQHFAAEFAPALKQLIVFLKEAGISHYSSGCGIKSVTFDLFPASDQVAKLMELLSLNRPYRPNSTSGLKDFSPMDGYNPAYYFVKYLKRWSGFAAIVMHNEGDSARGIAAAQAKALLDMLSERFGSTCKTVNFLRRSAAGKINEFAQLMQDIGEYLVACEEQLRTQNNQNVKENYQRAMAAATNRHAAA